MSYGWLTESSFHPSKRQEIKLDPKSIIQAKTRLNEEKAKIKQKASFPEMSITTLPIKKTISPPSIPSLTKEQEIQQKLSLKERLYNKILSNSELTQEEQEYKKRSLIDFNSKPIHKTDNQQLNEKTNILLSNEYDELFPKNSTATTNSNVPITNFLQLKKIRDQERHNRLLRIQKIKNKI